MHRFRIRSLPWFKTPDPRVHADFRDLLVEQSRHTESPYFEPLRVGGYTVVVQGTDDSRVPRPSERSPYDIAHWEVMIYDITHRRLTPENDPEILGDELWAPYWSADGVGRQMPTFVVVTLVDLLESGPAAYYRSLEPEAILHYAPVLASAGAH
jgi:hypothetical protein